MKLATALSERADLQRRITELGGRLNNNAKVQDGEKHSVPVTVTKVLRFCNIFVIVTGTNGPSV